MPSVVQEWMSDMPLKAQTVVLCALRGCDGVPVNDESKGVVRFIRKASLINADSKTSSFMIWDGPPILSDLGKYPAHFVQHIMHAVALIGDYHPNPAVVYVANNLYKEILEFLHLNPESKDQRAHRLRDI